MQKKMLWGLGVLVLLICTAFVFMTVRNRAEIRQLKEGTAVAEKPLEARDESTQPIADNKPPRPARAGFKWEWHGNHWHEMPVVQADVQEVVVPVEQMTAAQKAEWEKYWKDQGLEPPPVTAAQKAEWEKYWKDQGLEPPPPPGYVYVEDENGNISLLKYDTPLFEVKWSNTLVPGQDFYKLNEEEWLRYIALEHIASESLHRLEPKHYKLLAEGKELPKAVYSPGVVELAKEWADVLYRKASGPTPRVVTTIAWSHDPTPEDKANVSQQINELLNAAKKQRRPTPKNWTYNLETIIKELEKAVQRRK